MTNVMNAAQVYLHWTQPLTNCSHGTEENVEGISMLAFNAAGKVVQVFDWHTPSNAEREERFHPAAVMATTTAPASSLSTVTTDNWFDEHQAVLERQQQEWASF
mmetsp:Transcript_33763/g.100531  ORF Transcript_33763/g.100531 Transcript_33763/m.100531 type:complete len:104 (-) Transcript_33763:668-979(-)